MTKIDSTNTEFDGPTVAVTLEIENTYELYDDETTYASGVVIPAPPEDEDSDEFDTWKYEHIHCFTGVGHEDGDSWYDVTVVESSDPALVGREFDFGY